MFPYAEFVSSVVVKRSSDCVDSGDSGNTSKVAQRQIRTDMKQNMIPCYYGN